MKEKKLRYQKPSIKSKKVKLNYFYQWKYDDVINNFMATQVFAQSCGCGGCGCCECCACLVP